jgi:hypothetical protein
VISLQGCGCRARHGTSDVNRSCSKPRLSIRYNAAPSDYAMPSSKGDASSRLTAEMLSWGIVSCNSRHEITEGSKLDVEGARDNYPYTTSHVSR